MKLCWDSIEDLRYSKKTGKWYKGKQAFIYKEQCKFCGKPFLGRIKGKYCCYSCSTSDREISEETRQKMRDNHSNVKGRNNPNWKSGYIPTYDTYAPQIEWCEEVRRNPKDRNILEVRCVYCGKWYTPGLKILKSRIQHIKGNLPHEYRLYCSEGCKQACPIYGKSPETLMKEDAIRSGRLGWLELNREVQPELRKLVLKRDKYICQKCGEQNKSLHCHHILPVATDPLESADIDNCLTYCVDCHKEVHQQDGCRYGQLKVCIE